MDQKTKKLTVMGVFSAIGFILMFVQLQLPIMPSFIKLDISDFPALLCTFMFGPFSGVCVCLIKNLLHAVFYFGDTFGVGELSNFILGSVLCLSAGFFYQLKRTRKGALIAMLFGSIISGAVSFFTNFFIVYPIYFHIMAPEEAILAAYRSILPGIQSTWQALLLFNVPFTALKGILCSTVTFFLYKKLKKVLRLESY